MLAALGWVAGCAATGDGRAPPAATESTQAEESDLSLTMAKLAEQAIRQGDLDRARKRLDRALQASPQSVAARVGMGRLALARNRDAEARDWFDQALARDPDSVDALLGAAAAESRGDGDPEKARRHLERALARVPGHPEAHSAFAELTGRAPPAEATDADALAARATRHPYDPVAAFEAGLALARAGNSHAAIPQLENAVWMTDLHPETGFAAGKLLAQLDDAWRGRHLVPVRVYADEGIRARPGWEFRMRWAWKGISEALDPVLRTRFLPVSLAAFESAGEPNELGSMLRKFVRETQDAPHGILAAFTARGVPRRAGRYSLGLAEFLGRRLVVRFTRESRSLRMLAHEVLHLYGAIHVVDDIDSVMNADGQALVVDGLNVRIAQSLRNRHFLPGDREVNIHPYIELRQTVDAYRAALRANLLFRDAGVQDLLEARRRSRVEAAAISRRIERLDPHLADVSLFVAKLLIRDDRPVQGIYMLESAARLYGLQTPRGREAERSARRLRAIYLKDGGPS